MQQIIRDAADLARNLAFGEITLKIQHGRVVRAELHESHLPAEPSPWQIPQPSTSAAPVAIPIPDRDGIGTVNRRTA